MENLEQNNVEHLKNAAKKYFLFAISVLAFFVTNGACMRYFIFIHRYLELCSLFYGLVIWYPNAYADIGDINHILL